MIFQPQGKPFCEFLWPCKATRHRTGELGSKIQFVIEKTTKIKQKPKFGKRKLTQQGNWTLDWRARDRKELPVVPNGPKGPQGARRAPRRASVGALWGSGPMRDLGPHGRLHGPHGCPWAPWASWDSRLMAHGCPWAPWASWGPW